MSKDRLVACQHYINEGNCDLGKDGTFYNLCQTCQFYSPIPGGRPAKVDNRRKKKERNLRKELIKEEW